MDSVGIIGFGNMGEAIAKGLSRSENPVELCVLEPVEQKRRKAVDRYRAKAIDHPAELFAETDIMSSQSSRRFCPSSLPTSMAPQKGIDS